MTFVEDNRTYEAWLRVQCAVVEADLAGKHEKMRDSAFAFLRATCFRWARRIGQVCPELRDAPAVLAVGDAHVENFGSWRDAEGRLVWGINDFDEAAVTPYAFDLVRLAVSARLAPDPVLGNRKAAAAILEGYREGLKRPRPSLLDECETWMREYVACTDKERERFWDEVDEYPRLEPPTEVKGLLRRSLPEGARQVEFARRAVGTGGLGRPRFVAIATWRGGRVVREAKALVPSAWRWAHGVIASASPVKEMARGPHRAPDPHFDVAEHWILRRLAANSQKIELGRDVGEELHAKVLRAMGFDIGAVHAADRPAVSKIRAHLDAGRPAWLRDAAKAAAADVTADFRAWRALSP